MKGLKKVKLGLKKQKEKYHFFRGLKKAKFAIMEIGFYLDKKIRISTV